MDYLVGLMSSQCPYKRVRRRCDDGERDQRERLEDAIFLALTMEEGPQSTKCRWPLEAQKGKGFCPRASRRNVILLTQLF